MVCVGGDAHIVVPVQSQAGGESLRSVALALVGELLGALAQISVEDALEAYFPLWRNLLG